MSHQKKFSFALAALASLSMVLMADTVFAQRSASAKALGRFGTRFYRSERIVPTDVNYFQPINPYQGQAGTAPRGTYYAAPAPTVAQAPGGRQAYSYQPRQVVPAPAQQQQAQAPAAGYNAYPMQRTYPTRTYSYGGYGGAYYGYGYGCR